MVTLLNHIIHLVTTYNIPNGNDIINLLSKTPNLAACEISNKTYGGSIENSFNVINKYDQVVMYFSRHNFLYNGCPKVQCANKICKEQVAKFPKLTITQRCINGTKGYRISDNVFFQNYFNIVETQCR